jgi:hypothetical protein
MANASPKINTLHGTAQFALFVTSYLPLFILIMLRQIAENYPYLNYAGFNRSGISFYFSKFCLSSVLLVSSLFGTYGFFQTLRNLKTDAPNGFPIVVKDLKNKNSESIGYIATYIIPFLFQGFNSFYECISVLLLLIIIYRIYINSTLLLINPVLSIQYGLYEIEFDEAGKTKNGLIISPNKYLQEDDKIVINSIGHKLFYAH